MKTWTEKFIAGFVLTTIFTLGAVWFVSTVSMHSARADALVAPQPLGDVPILASAPTVITQGINVRGASRLTVICRDNNSTATRIQGVETATLELWWLGSDKLWHTNSDDNIAPSATKDLFSFELNGFDRFVLRKASGNDFYCSVTVR